jgi:hypothetical protein
MKITDWKRYTLLGSAISIQLVISLLMLPIDHIERAIGQVEEATTIFDVDFDSPQDNTFNLGTPFLVQYDNTTSLKPIGEVGLGNFKLTFAGYGIINGTVSYNDNGTGIYITNPNDGTVYQKGIIEIRTEDGSDSIKTTYESVSSSSNNSQSNNTNIILDNGAMFFDPSSSNRGELLFLNNKVGIYKDMIDLNRGNLITIAWEWK